MNFSYFVFFLFQFYAFIAGSTESEPDADTNADKQSFQNEISQPNYLTPALRQSFTNFSEQNLPSSSTVSQPPTRNFSGPSKFFRGNFGASQIPNHSLGIPSISSIPTPSIYGATPVSTSQSNKTDLVASPLISYSNTSTTAYQLPLPPPAAASVPAIGPFDIASGTGFAGGAAGGQARAFGPFSGKSVELTMPVNAPSMPTEELARITADVVSRLEARVAALEQRLEKHDHD